MKSSEKNRFQNAFTVCNIGLDSVVSDISRKSATLIIDYLLSYGLLNAMVKNGLSLLLREWFLQLFTICFQQAKHGIPATFSKLICLMNSKQNIRKRLLSKLSSSSKNGYIWSVSCNFTAALQKTYCKFYLLWRFFSVFNSFAISSKIFILLYF